jgi:hypothetical protein
MYRAAKWLEAVMRSLIASVGVLLSLGAFAHAAAPVTTAPVRTPPVTSAPATSAPAASHPAKLEPMVGGAIRFEPPPDPWTAKGNRTDGLAAYILNEGQGFMEVAVSPLDGTMTEAARLKYTVDMGKAIREQAKTENAELVYGPRAEKEERFWLKMHDKRKLASGTIVDRVQLFRIFGTYIARVTVTAVIKPNDDASSATALHQAGADLLDRMKVARGVKPTYFPRSQVKIVPPVDWKENKIDKQNDVVAVYVDDAKPSSKIIVRARVMPKDARVAGPKQDALVAKMIDDERLTAPFSKTSPSPGEQPESDDKALKRVKAIGTAEGKPVAVDTRYFIVGDSMISVRAASDPADATAMSEMASKIAVTTIRD